MFMHCRRESELERETEALRSMATLLHCSLQTTADYKLTTRQFNLEA